MILRRKLCFSKSDFSDSFINRRMKNNLNVIVHTNEMIRTGGVHEPAQSLSKTRTFLFIRHDIYIHIQHTSLKVKSRSSSFAKKHINLLMLKIYNISVHFNYMVRRIGLTAQPKTSPMWSGVGLTCCMSTLSWDYPCDGSTYY